VASAHRRDVSPLRHRTGGLLPTFGIRDLGGSDHYGGEAVVGGGLFSLVLFGLLSVSTYLAMEIYSVVRPERSDEVLTSLKAWIDRHTDLIIVIVAAAVGLWFIGKSAYLLAT